MADELRWEASATECAGHLSSLDTQRHSWQVALSAVAAWVLTEHLVRPLWVRVMRTPFPLDRYVYLLILSVLWRLLSLFTCLVLYLMFSLRFYLFIIKLSLFQVYLPFFLQFLQFYLCRVFTFLVGACAAVFQLCRRRGQRVPSEEDPIGKASSTCHGCQGLCPSCPSLPTGVSLTCSFLSLIFSFFTYRLLCTYRLFVVFVWLHLPYFVCLPDIIFTYRK